MFYISGFYDEVSSDLKKQLQVMAGLGEKYLCPRSVNGKNIADYTAEEFERDILPILNSAGVKLSSIGSPIGKIPLGDGAAYEAQKRKLKELIKIAKLTGCRYIRCFSFFADEPDKKSKAVTDRFRGFLELAEGSDIVLLHENEKKIYGDISRRVLELYQSLGHPLFKLCFDASNYVQCGEDPLKAYEATKAYTVYYHMKDCDGPAKIEVPLGTGDGKIKEIIADLTANGYDGFLTLEPHTAKYALLKIPYRFIPFNGLTAIGKAFRKIDAERGIKALQKVSREEVFIWQHENLKKLIKEAEGKN